MYDTYNIHTIDINKLSNNTLYRLYIYVLFCFKSINMHIIRTIYIVHYTTYVQRMYIERVRVYVHRYLYMVICYLIFI